jgi:hypothetical protein
MSGRLTSTNRRKRRAVARVAFVALCGLACGLLTSLSGVSGLAGRAQAQPKAPTSPDDVKKIDHKNPLAADAPGRQPHEKFAVQGSDRLMFAKIEDFKPVASEAENKFEYDAWCEVVGHAKQFATTDLESHAARDVSVIELLKPIRTLFRTELLRFDGQLVCVRRLDAPLFFQNNPNLGVKELYEARLVPVDESPLTPVSIVFLDLPEALAAVRQKAVGEWLTFDEKDPKYASSAKVWISAAGYYFKTMSVPGEEANAVVGVPVLIGKSVTKLSGPPTPAGTDPTAIDPKIRVFKHIKDETELFRAAPGEVPWEVAAYTRVLLHAHRFTPEQLEEHALTDVKFADLFLDSRAAFRLKLVRFEGRLISLRKSSASPELRAVGIEQVYEGWLVPANEPRGNPVRIDFIEPLAGVETDRANSRVNKWVSFAGYSFKKVKYESAEDDPKNPGKKLHKYAPLLLGVSPIARPDPDRPTSVTWASFVLWAIVGGVVLIASAGVLTWYYRGGDKKAKEAMDTVRHRNPFDAANGPPPA